MLYIFGFLYPKFPDSMRGSYAGLPNHKQTLNVYQTRLTACTRKKRPTLHA